MQNMQALATTSRVTTQYNFSDILDVMRYALELTSHLDQQSVLQSFVETALSLTGAKYGALGIVDRNGRTLNFVYSGITPMLAEKIGAPPLGKGMFADIPSDTFLIVNDIQKYTHHFPFPEHHPKMKNFLGVPVRSQGHIYGRLYLADKPGGFTKLDGDLLSLLGQATAIAINNARLYAESKLRAEWIATSRMITTTLLEGADEEETLEMIAREMRRVSRSDLALLVLPSVGDTWVCEIANGEGAFEFIGMPFLPGSDAYAAIQDGTGSIIDTLENSSMPELTRFGAALYAPMTARDKSLGVIVLLRNAAQSAFDLSDLNMAETVTKQAGLALELAEARQSDAEAEAMEDRARISRDLHDFTIQQLFATGMELSAARDTLSGEGADHTILDALERGINSIDESVGQIRQIIYSLRDATATIPFMDRVRQEIKQATNSLGFAPYVLIKNLGEVVDNDETRTDIDDEIGSDIADDLIAVMRECLSNAARHAQATDVSVSLVIENHKVALTIEDDGKGVDTQVSRRSGLSNLAARARRHHGTFSIKNGAGGKGTRVEWTAIVA